MTSFCDSQRSMIVLIDLQERLLPAIDNGQSVVERALVLARAGKELSIPVLGTEQYPEGLGPSHPHVRQLCDRMVEKTYFDASSQDDFLSQLDPNRNELLIAGCEAHVCVLQTVLGLIDQGYLVRLVADAIGSRRLSDREAAIARASAAGATIVTSEMVIFEWLRHSHHPSFRSLLKLVK